MRVRHGEPNPSAALNEAEYAEWWQQTGLRELRQLLYWLWDPVGVADAFPATWDEYDQYAKVLLSRLRDDDSVAPIAQYLRSVERDSMGGHFNDDARLKFVAERVNAWYGESLDHWGHTGKPIP